MMQTGFQQINSTVRLVLIPGIVITVLATSFNVIADGVRDAARARCRGSVGRAEGMSSGQRARCPAPPWRR